MYSLSGETLNEERKDENHRIRHLKCVHEMIADPANIIRINAALTIISRCLERIRRKVSSSSWFSIPTICAVLAVKSESTDA